MLELLAQVADSSACETAVDLELRLAGAEACSSATAEALCLQVPPHASQSGQHVLEFGQLDLELALTALGMQREDVEDERRAVEDARRPGCGPRGSPADDGVRSSSKMTVSASRVGGELARPRRPCRSR